jgi:hypothetical protein
MADILGAEGKLTLLRVNEGGYGPPNDFLDCEVVLRLDSEPNKAFGFQLRNDGSGPMHAGMLEILRTAWNNNWNVAIEYMIDPGKSTGYIIRVYLHR